MATLAPPMSSSRTTPAGPLVRSVERVMAARGWGPYAMDDLYRETYGTRPGTLARMLQRGRESGVYANRTAAQLQEFITVVLDAPVLGSGEARRCCNCGCRLRSTQSHAECDPCRGAH